MIKEDDPKIKVELRRELSDTTLPRWLGFLENLLENNGNTGFFVGESMTIADLAAWLLCGWISEGGIDGIPVNILDTYPLLFAHQKKISHLPVSGLHIFMDLVTIIQLKGGSLIELLMIDQYLSLVMALG